MTLVYSPIMAGTDHLHAFARLLRMEEPYVLSLSALLRSFGEVMGRAWWLLESQSPEQFAHRSAVLFETEAREATGRTFVTLSADGTRTIEPDPSGRAQRLLSAKARKGERERVPNFTKLYEQVCDGCGVDGKGATYEELSAAAHGSTLAIGGMSHVGPQRPDGSSVVSLGLPIDHAENSLWVFVRVSDGVIRRLAHLNGAELEIERLDQIVGRVDDTCREVLTILREAVFAPGP